MQDFDADMQEIMAMKAKKLAIAQKSEQLQKQLDSLGKPKKDKNGGFIMAADEISDLHTVNEESEYDRREEEDDYPFGESKETVVRTKSEAREFIYEEICLQNVIEEWIFDHAIKVEKVKATLQMFISRFRYKKAL